MPVSRDVAVRGVDKRSLDALLGHLGHGSIAADERYDALARYEELPVRSIASAAVAAGSTISRNSISRT